MKGRATPEIIIQCAECGRKLIDQRYYRGFNLPVLMVKSSEKMITLCYPCYERLKKKEGKIKNE